MSATDNKDLVLGFFEKMAAGLQDEALEALHDDATWLVSGTADHVPIAGTYTKTTLPELQRTVYAAMPDNLAMTITSVTADDDRVVLEANPRGVSPVGRTYDNRNVFVVEVSGGKIHAIREYYDTMHTSEILFGTSYSHPATEGSSR